MRLYFLLTILLIVGCTSQNASSELDINDTWQLLSGTKIQGTDTTYTDYTKDQKVLKIINDTHFSFVRHDLKKGEDSTFNVFVAGAGSYELNGSTYKENLEFCSFRPWENNDFEFELSLHGDTLTQTGIERIEELNVDQIITEVYIRASKK